MVGNDMLSKFSGNWELVSDSRVGAALACPLLDALQAGPASLGQAMPWNTSENHTENNIFHILRRPRPGWEPWHTLESYEENIFSYPWLAEAGASQEP